MKEQEGGIVRGDISMDEFLKEALELVKAQGSFRVMDEDEITTLMQRLAVGIKNIAEGDNFCEGGNGDSSSDPKKSIKEKSITCLECGKAFKILTRRHLISHGLDAADRKRTRLNSSHIQQARMPSSA